MQQKINLGLIFGGQSAEHEVSLKSAQNIIQALDRDKYNLTLIGIDAQGSWFLNDASAPLLAQEKPNLLKLNKENQVALVPSGGKAQLIQLSNKESLSDLDVIFPVLHGTFGEDGAIQGFLKMTGIPFVGSGILGSAVGMDKDIMKRLLLQAGIPTPPFVVGYSHQRPVLEDVLEELGGFPIFVKPANLGSSVGIHKVSEPTQFQDAVNDALRYDHKIILEKGLNCREIECSVLGNTELKASLPGEVIVQADFYSYEAKYIQTDGARLQIPADLNESQVQRVQDLAMETFRVLNCEGLARVDFFMTPDGEFWVNEVNTLPGFTRISMYPKLWEASGLEYSYLIDELIRLAINKAESQAQLQTQFHV